MPSDERTFTQAEVSAIVQRRLREVKGNAMPDEVQRELLRNILERLDAIEKRLDPAP